MFDEESDVSSIEAERMFLDGRFVLGSDFYFQKVIVLIQHNYMYIYIIHIIMYLIHILQYMLKKCVCFEIFLLTSGVSLFVRGMHVVCVMRTQMCIMAWVWQVLQGEGDLWGHFQCPNNSKHLSIIQSEFFGGKVEMQSHERAKFRCRALAHTVCTV